MPDQIIDLSEMMRKSSADEFWGLRAKALQVYANLEQSMFNLFTFLSRTDGKTAGIIFFKVTNTNARNAILEKLFKNFFGDAHNLFRNSLIAHLPAIDNRRNEIVHWNTVNNAAANEAGETVVEVTLKPPSHWGWTEETPELKAHHLVEFIVKCDFYARLCNMFYLVHCLNPPSMNEDERQPWLDIFVRPIQYPPPRDHPLVRKLRALPTPPES
jgi:hypothetical protein